MEFALTLTLGLFMLAGALDLAWNVWRVGLVDSGVAFAAQVAALGRPDYEVEGAAVGRSRGVLRRGTVSYTPCWLRTSPGNLVHVEAAWRPTPLTPMLQPFWARIWREDVYAATVYAVLPCRPETL